MTRTKSSARETGVVLDSVCTIHLGGELFAVRLTDLVEVVTGVQLHPCPLSPAYIAGLMHYRGDVLTMIHLRALLGLPPISAAAESRSISMVMTGAHGLFAMQADGVGEVRSLEAASLEPVPALVDRERHSFLQGVYKLEDGLLPLLDVQRLEPVALRAWATAHAHEAIAAGRQEQKHAMAS